MKKIITFILAISMLLSLPAASVGFAENTVSISLQEAPDTVQGKEVSLKVFIDSEPHWAAIDISFNYNPEALSFKKFVLNQELKNQSDDGEPAVYALNRNYAAEGTIIVAYATATSVGGYEGYYPGEYDYFGTITFTVNTAAPIGESEIELVIGKICDKDQVDVPFEVSGSKVNILCAHNWQETDRVDAKCESDGYAVYSCSKCYEEKSEVISQLGHEWDNGSVTAPTCEEGGYTTYTCKHNAEHTYVADYTEATGHSWKELSRIEATCSSKGLITYVCANNAEHTKTEDIAIAPDAHDYQSVVTAPTCEEGGYTTYTCKHNAEHTYVADYTEALGHDWGEWLLTKEATIDEDGVETRTCKNDPSHTEERAVPYIMRGDFDFDRQITVADALMALRISAKIVATNELYILIGDIDYDGAVTVSDALAILRVAARMADSL